MVQDSSIADVDGVPYVAWTQIDSHGVENQKLHVVRLNAAGSAWETVGGPGPLNHDPQTGEARTASLASVGGVPHVAWVEYEGPGGSHCG